MMNQDQFPPLEQVRKTKPLVHHITNYVTVNDCANITLAVGGSPIMADAPEEAGDIAAMASALVLNLGTLKVRTVEAMIIAGKAANEKGTPVVLDPVGAGASNFRNEAANRILREVRISILRGNISEIRFLAGLAAQTKGVDASETDMAGAEDSRQVARALAQRLGCVVAITGAVDVVSDGERVVCIHNGHPMLSSITGTGCMCSSLVGACCGAAPNALLDAAVCALTCMGVAGELAFERAGSIGNGSFRAALLDAVSRMDSAMLRERGKPA